MRQGLNFNGLAISRTLRALALAKGQKDLAAEIAAARWGEGSEVGLLAKALTNSSTWANAFASTQAGADFFKAVSQREVLSRLPGIRRVPPRLTHVAANYGTRASFVREHQAIPVSVMQLLAEALATRKVACISFATNEQLTSASIEVENILTADMIRAVIEATDAALLEPGNDGTGAEPASICYGAPSSASTGDAVADFSELMEGFAGDLTSAALVMHPLVAMQLALTGNNAFQGIGATGGECLGLPVLTSRTSPIDSEGAQIALVDGTAIAVAEEMPELATSQAGLIDLATIPDETITYGVSQTVSLFQAELTALRVIRPITWRVMREGAVSVLTGASYGSSS
ncbi:MAG: phage major capsid protein [Gammaproteobacteria bacterium]|nr:phage major capsid protein [Gammaproteobacteria bacterium]